MVLRDPLELRERAGRTDPPIEDWPGRPIERDDVMDSCGDPRDWFRYRHREREFEEAWGEFADARRRRRNIMAGYDWDQTLILGDYGAFKTTLGIMKLRHFFGLGHAGFANASALFAWRVEGEDVYTAKGKMPKASVELVDEASAFLASRLGHGLAVETYGEDNLNTRKQLCKTFYMSAQDRKIAASIRVDCKEVWKPVDKDDIYVVDSYGGAKDVPANDLDNFRLAWHVWDKYPYRKRDLIEGKDDDDGFGPPSATYYVEGEEVRRAMLLNDTFQLAQVGAATMADRDRIKDDLARRHGVAGPSSKRQEQTERLLRFFEDNEKDAPEYFTAGTIGGATGIPSAQVGVTLRELVNVRNVQRKGYPTKDIYDGLERLKVVM